MGRKKKGKVVITQADYDRVAGNCIACLVGVQMVHRQSGYYHWYKDESQEYALCENTDALTALFKGLSEADKETAANEMMYVITEARVLGIASTIQYLIDDTPKEKLKDVLTDFCEEAFRAGLVEGVSRRGGDFTNQEPT